MPRCDLLVWILVTKLAPTYYQKLDQLLKETARYRELSSWRKGFKKAWRKLEKTPITLPLNDAYKPEVAKWICTCPSFVVSRFLLCKHLVQGMRRVPPIFFLEAERHRQPPFWRHGMLKALDANGVEPPEMAGGGGEDEGDEEIYNDEDDEDEGDDEGAIETHQHDGRTFEEAMSSNLNLISNFVTGLRYQVQFRDQRMLNVLEREGASFLRLAKACMEKERRMNTTRGPTVATWERSTSSAMFYRTRPTLVDQRT